MSKDICTHFARGILMRSGFITYTPDFVADYDLLLFDEKNNEYKRVYVAKVSDDKPIIILKTSRQGKAVVRIFDLLIAIHPTSLTCWMIPSSDLPEVESLYLSKKYEAYLVSIIAPQDLNLTLKRSCFNDVRKVKESIKAEIKEKIQQEIAANEVMTSEEINNLLGDLTNDNN